MALALRLPGISKGFRSDEVGTILYASSAPKGLVQAIISNDSHPPLLYAFYHVWLQGGREEWWARLPIVFCGVIVCVLLYCVARQQFSERVSVTAAWIAAIAPSTVLLSQTIRQYMPAAVFVLLAVFFALKWEEDNQDGARPGAGYVLSASLALYTFYFSAMTLAALSMYIIVRSWRPWRRIRAWLLLQAVVA